MTSIQIRISAPTPSLITPPPGRYFRLLYDWETDEYGGGVRPSVQQNGGEPATMKSRYDVWVDMPESFQRWFFEVFRLFAPTSMSEATVKDKWAQYWHSRLAWTNFSNGSDAKADYINGTNLDKPPMAKETLGSRGNVLRLLEDKQDGSKYYPFEAITVSSHLSTPPRDFAQMWWLCNLATIQNVNKFSDGTYQVDRFPQLDGNDVPLPMLSNDGVIWFEKSKVREVAALPRFNPYNPDRPFAPQF